MSGKLRPVQRALAALAIAALTVGIPVASAHKGSDDLNPVATHVTDVRADLTDVVSGDGAPFSWHFDYGTTQDYGSETEAIADSGSNDDKSVTATVKGLQPATTYHARLTWRINGENVHGDDITFTTATADDADPAAGRAEPIAAVAVTVVEAVAAEVNHLVAEVQAGAVELQLRAAAHRLTHPRRLSPRHP